MEDNQEFILEIENLLNQKAAVLEEKLLQRLHENFSIYHKSVQTIFNVLVRKALLSEDPYKYEQKISEVTIPSQLPIAENDKGMQMSIRISNFESQLDYLNHYYQFNLEFLNMKRIKMLATLTTYIKWERGGSTSDPNTSILFEMIHKVDAESDSMSNGILKSSVQNLIKQTKLILKDLKELSSYHREAYKQDIRQKVLPLLKIDEKSYALDSDGTTMKVRHKFSNIMEGAPFYSDLVNEMLAELYSENGPALRKTLLSRYQAKKKKQTLKKEVSHKTLLIDALKILGGGGTYLDQGMVKIRTNISIIENRKESLGEKFRKWLQGLVSRDGSQRIMELDIFDEETGLSKTVTIDFNSFSEKAGKLSRLLQAFGSEMSQTYQKLTVLSEEELYNYLASRVTEFQKTVSFLAPIETFLKTEARREQRGRLVSLEKEISNIKSCIKRTNAKRFDYSSRKEEQDQLKRLGINS